MSSILSNRYDLGDVLGSILMYTSIAAWTGIGGATLYGYNLTEPAVSTGFLAIPMYTLGMFVAVFVAFITNGQLTVTGLQRRPIWEKFAVAATILFPVLVDNVGALEDAMLAGHLEGTLFGLLALTGYIIVAFRRDNDKKASLYEAASRLATEG